MGTGSVAIGWTAGMGLNGGPPVREYSVAIGRDSGGPATQSVSVGQSAGYRGNDFSTCVGASAGNNGGTGGVSVGYGAGQRQKDYATCVGFNSGNDAAERAVCVGYQAGFSRAGQNSILIGSQAGYSSAAANCIVISASGSRLDNTIPNSCKIAPIRNINGTTSTRMYYNTSTSELSWGTETSARRYKTNIQDMDETKASKVLSLRACTFDELGKNKYGLVAAAEPISTDPGDSEQLGEGGDPEGVDDGEDEVTTPEEEAVSNEPEALSVPNAASFGLIAEEVEAVYPEMVVYNPLTHEVEGVMYDKLVAPLIKMVQILHERVKVLEAKSGP